MDYPKAKKHLERCLNLKVKKVCFPPKWTPEHEEGWRKEPAAIFFELERNSLNRKTTGPTQPFGASGGPVPFTDK